MAPVDAPVAGGPLAREIVPEGVYAGERFEASSPPGERR